MPQGVESYFINYTILFMAIETIVAFSISLYLYQFRDTPGTGYLAFMQFSTAVWAASYCMEFSAIDPLLKLLWAKITYLGITSIPLFLYFFACRFADPQDKKIPLRRQLLLIGIAVLFITLVITNQYHHLIWTSFHVNPKLNTSVYTYGVAFWLLFAFSYGLTGLSLVVVFKKIYKRPKKFRKTLKLIYLAVIFPVVGNLIYVFKINPVPSFDWTPTTFLISGCILAYINIRFRTFNLLPFARKILIDFMHDAVLFTDAKNFIADLNPAFQQFTGEKEDHLIGRQVSAIKFFQQQTELSKIIQYTSTRLSQEITIELTPGKIQYFELTIYPVFDVRGRLNGKFLLLRDITSLKQKNKEITNANEKLTREIEENHELISALDAFAHTIAHDLKDPVGGILSASILLDDDLSENNLPSALETNQLIQFTARKTLKVISELLEMATITDKEINISEVDMKQVIQESLHRLHEPIRQYQATIEQPSSWPGFNSQPAWLEEVWVNFIHNALKYGGTPPSVQLGYVISANHKTIKCWVKDNGKGLIPEQQAKLFRKYSRLEKQRAEGTGLGLFIVKRIIERLGGKVGIESHPDIAQGSVFYFILPLDQ